MFLASGLASVAFIVAYVVDAGRRQRSRFPGFGSTNASNLLLGITMGLALFLIGAAAIHWAKKLMPDVEIVQERAPEASEAEHRDALLDEYRRGVDESGVKRRPFILGSMVAALGLAGLPAIVLLRDLGPLPGDALREHHVGTGARTSSSPRPTRRSARRTSRSAR